MATKVVKVVKKAKGSTQETEVKTTFAKWLAAKDRVSEATTEYQEVNDALVDIMAKAKVEKVTVDTGPVIETGTYVAPERVQYDSERLRKAVGATVWDKITSRTLDTEKLAQAIAAGIVSAEVVAQHTDVVPVKPHIKRSSKRNPAFKVAAKKIAKKVVVVGSGRGSK